MVLRVLNEVIYKNVRMGGIEVVGDVTWNNLRLFCFPPYLEITPYFSRLLGQNWGCKYRESGASIIVLGVHGLFKVECLVQLDSVSIASRLNVIAPK